MYIEKGSVWRKWDLQIHTPGAKHADQYKARDGDDPWLQFIDHLKNSDVSVFGITDYFSVDSYETLLQKIEAKDKELLQNKLFLPNIELRLDISTNKAGDEIHIHLIFSKDCGIGRIKKFLNSLETTSTKQHNTKYRCNPEDLKQVGYDKASVSLDKIKEALSSEFGNEKPFFKVGAYKGYGGFVYGHPEKKGESGRKKILSDEVDKFCDFVFGNEADREWFLRDDRYEDKKTKSEKKPVVATSDCHNFNDCEDRLGKKYFIEDDKKGKLEKFGFSWIKADITFEGLKQIIFEPDDRVAFGHLKPDTKKSYYLIDTVRFIDNTGQNNFPATTLEINHNLATIIGGKSTGKSLLLHYIAKCADPGEVEDRVSDLKPKPQYNFDDEPEFNLEITWADGKKAYLKNRKEGDDSRKVLYIPQGYIDQLSEESAKSRETLNKFIRDLLVKDEVIKHKYESGLGDIRRLLKLIATGVTNVYQLKDEIALIKEHVKELGDKKGIESYIKQLKEESDEIKNKSGLSPEESKNYETLLEEEKKVSTEIAVLQADQKTILSFKEDYLRLIDSMQAYKDEQANHIVSKPLQDVFKKEFKDIEAMRSSSLTALDKITQFAKGEIGALEKKLKQIKSRLNPLMAQIELQDELKKKLETIKEEQKKVDRIDLVQKDLSAKEKNYKKERVSIIKTYKDMYDTYKSLGGEFKKYESKLDDISLNISVGFNTESFNEEVIKGHLNRRDIKARIEDIEYRDEYEYKYDPDKHMHFIETISNAVIDGEIKAINQKTTRDALVKILDNYFDLDFKITYRNDSLDKMSPGKKGLVLLRLLIDLSDAEWPILLDQPEDDLDNRSIYKDLVSFIKDKKKQRQIIIVTHNPNLVVGADAEEVVVANQSGQEDDRDNEKYQFEYVSGALEHSFESSSRKYILISKGIRQHVCEILEGGQEAFQKREKKYSFHR